MSDYTAEVEARLLHDDFGGGDTPPARQRQRWLDVRAALGEIGRLHQRVEELEQGCSNWTDTAAQFCRNSDYWRERAEAAEAKLAEAQAEFLGWNEAQASGRELELEAKLADALVKADCGATTPEPCRLSPPCLTCYTVAKEAEVERLREAITGLRAAHHSGDRDEWEAAVRAALRGGGE